mmetsp:Transcript_42834/g.118398  ORF Transcript_42834/g.118398 Transcript_42834/m.118398 type:complete len:346 (-) Transcript_42834:2286-3323(-)
MRRRILEVQTDLFVHLEQVLLANHAIPHRWAVLIQVFRPEALHRVRVEPGARYASRTLLVGLLVGRYLLKAEARHHIEEDQRVDDDVQEEKAQAQCDLHVKVHTMIVFAAAGLGCLVGHATQEDATRKRQHPLSPPVHVEAREVASWDAAKHAVVVVAVYIDMGDDEAPKQVDHLAAHEEKNEDGEGQVYADVGVAGQVQLCAFEVPLCVDSLHFLAAANDELHDLVRRVNSENRLQEERDQECGRETVRQVLVGQYGLVSKGLETLCVHVGALAPLPTVPLGVHHNLPRDYVCDKEVQDHIRHDREEIEQHVALFPAIDRPEADTIGDVAAHEVHEAVPDHDDH